MKALLDGTRLLAIWLLRTYMLVVFIYCMFTWLLVGGRICLSNPLVQHVYDCLLKVTEPALHPVRSYLPQGGLVASSTPDVYHDLSPLALAAIVYFVVCLLERFPPVWTTERR